MDIRARTRRALEWDSLVEHLACEACTVWGRELCVELEPHTEKALVELEESIAHMRQKQSTNQSGSQTIKNDQGLKAQRIPIEFNKPDDPFDDDSDRDSMDTAFPKPLSKDERDARRRAILEDLRAGTISLEEAELRLMNLN